MSSMRIWPEAKSPIIGYYKPIFDNEATFQAEVYHTIRKVGLKAVLECKVPSKAHTSGNMRIDIGVLCRGHIIAAIEIKTDGFPALHTRQGNGYKDFGKRFNIPIIFLNPRADLDLLCLKLKSIKFKFLLEYDSEKRAVVIAEPKIVHSNCIFVRANQDADNVSKFKIRHAKILASKLGRRFPELIVKANDVLPCNDKKSKKKRASITLKLRNKLLGVVDIRSTKIPTQLWDAQYKSASIFRGTTAVAKQEFPEAKIFITSRYVNENALIDAIKKALKV